MVFKAEGKVISLSKSLCAIIKNRLHLITCLSYAGKEVKWSFEIGSDIRKSIL